MAEHLAQQFVDLRNVGLAALRLAEFGLAHPECGLGEGPAVIVP